MEIKILMYRLRKNFRSFGINYSKCMKTLEISLYFWNIIVMFGKEKEVNNYVK